MLLVLDVYGSCALLDFYITQKYEEDIAKMEAQQGNDVKFINPEVSACRLGDTHVVKPAVVRRDRHCTLRTQVQSLFNP